jgi:hypothetical protein
MEKDLDGLGFRYWLPANPSNNSATVIYFPLTGEKKKR